MSKEINKSNPRLKPIACPKNDLDKFDWKYYVNSHDDLQKAGINTHEKAYSHWIAYGKKENRKCCSGNMDVRVQNIKSARAFDWRYYVNTYDDLRKAGINTYEKAYDHWVVHGKKENRKCCRSKNTSSPVQKNTSSSVQKNGTSVQKVDASVQKVDASVQNSVPDDTFDWITYINTYDLAKIGINTREAAYTHWMEYGQKQIRLPAIFDWEYYVYANPDLHKVNINTQNAAYKHWINFGKKEGRKPIVRELRRGNLCNARSQACQAPSCSNRCCVTNMLEILESCQRICHESSVPLILASETLYSFINQKFIDADHSTINVMSLLSLRSKFLSNMDLIVNVGYVVREKSEGSVDIVYSATNGNYINITFIDDSDPNEYKLRVNSSMKRIPKEIMLPLQNAQLYGIDIFIPSDADKFINDIYGGALGPIWYPARGLNLITNNQDRCKNDYNIDSCYVINDFRMHDRWYNVVNECNKYNLCAKRVDAVMGRTLNRNKLIEDGVLDKDSPLKLNEAGCYLSHIKIWKEISSLPDSAWCLVLEDDVTFYENFHGIMKEIKGTLENIEWDVAYLGSWLFPRTELNSRQLEKIGKYVYLTEFTLGTHAYIITPKAARKILDNTFPIRVQIDRVMCVPHPKHSRKEFPNYLKEYDSRFMGKLNKINICEDDKASKHIGIIGATSDNSTSTTSMVCCND
jgi:GR25 family glycosyltransferase involved in LPS biosynthesis